MDQRKCIEIGVLNTNKLINNQYLYEGCACESQLVTIQIILVADKFVLTHFIDKKQKASVD